MVAPLGAAIPRALRSSASFTAQLSTVPGTKLSKAANGTVTIELVAEKLEDVSRAGIPATSAALGASKEPRDAESFTPAPPPCTVPDQALSRSTRPRDRDRAVAMPPASSSVRVVPHSVALPCSPAATTEQNILEQCIGGYLFQSSAATHQECLSRMLLGAPASATADVLALRPRASVLFLYSATTRAVLGTLTPIAPSGLLLEPEAWASDGRPSPYPAQVRIFFDCPVHLGALNCSTLCSNAGPRCLAQ